MAGAQFIVLHSFQKIIGNMFVFGLLNTKVGKLQSMGQ